MEVLNGVTIYWLVTIGLMIGYVTELIMGKRGMNLVGNLIGGVAGSVIVGVSAIMLNLFGALLYAAIGSFAFLFLVNIFKYEPEYKDDTEIVS